MRLRSEVGEMIVDDPDGPNVITRAFVRGKQEDQRGFSGGSVGKESACQCRSPRRHRFDAWVRKISWRRKWKPSPVFLSGESHAQRSLLSYSPRGQKESDMTENSRRIRVREGDVTTERMWKAAILFGSKMEGWTTSQGMWWVGGAL